MKGRDTRRQEIITAAQNRFATQGYTKTAVETIIQDVGIAKGTFYYYFKGKQDILKAIVENITLAVETYFASIVEDKQLSVMQKLFEIFVGEKKQALIQLNIMDTIHLPENRDLQEQLNVESVRRITPLITEIFLQGYQTGLFKKKVSLESMKILLAGIHFTLDSGLFDWTAVQRGEFLLEIQKIFESLADAQPGTFDFIVNNVRNEK